ncbi:unnamed protein product [Clonostachys rhizophaga]|uniref:SAP domain-containing protein n=1 Tax=Clonostachys rhizophaga TaxID=160324 RepID=A0A9N9VUP6_9HYPO|nr:unnamed protein product [Clonostachys rhizophaga]
MAEYTSLKVPELKKLLAEKGLSQTGNKADLVARLAENDQKKAEEEAKQPEPEKADTKKQGEHDTTLNPYSSPHINPCAEEPKEDEITYSDDEAPATKAAPAAESTASTAEAPKEEPAAEDSAKPADEGAEAAAEAPKPSYAIGLASSSADAEAKKRAERAKRFGIEEDDDNKKLSERAKRFGLDDKEIPAGLDSALPERPLKRGRGRENDGKANGRANKRQSLDRRGGRRRGGRQGGNEGGSNAGAKPRSNILSDPAEKAKAEKRAARFASS